MGEKLNPNPLPPPNLFGDDNWFKMEQIETTVNINGSMTEGEMEACRKKLIVLHECGEDKKALIEQLETMILGLKTNFDWFAS